MKITNNNTNPIHPNNKDDEIPCEKSKALQDILEKVKSVEDSQKDNQAGIQINYTYRW